MVHLARGLLPGDMVKMTLVSDTPRAWYSGMLPACLAHIYQPSELQICLQELASWCGARFVHARAKHIDYQNNTLLCNSWTKSRDDCDDDEKESGGDNKEREISITYDILAVNIGSITKGTDEIPGVKDYTLTTRPISHLLAKLEAFEQRKGWDQWDRVPKIVIVGGGAAGVELSLALKARVQAQCPKSQVDITIISKSRQILLERGSWTSRTVMHKLKENDIHIISDVRVTSVSSERIHLNQGDTMDYDLVVWATGAGAAPIFQESGLLTDENGFIKVSQTLVSKSSNNIFGVGDCCSIEGYEWIPKAGVYAVREGPILGRNILKTIRGQSISLDKYSPQATFLSLMVAGNGEAIGSYRGIPYTGLMAWKLKDWIDRSFLHLFDVSRLGPSPATEL